MKSNNELKLVIDGKEVDLAQFFKQEEQEEAHADTDAIKDADTAPKDDETREDNAESVDKRALIDEIGGILKDKGLDEEIIRTVIGKAEKIAYDGSETSESDNELPDDDKPADKFEGEDDDKDVENACKSKNEDEECEEKREDVATKVANAMAKRDAGLRRAYNAASEIMGEFNPFGLNERQILVRAANAAGVPTSGKESIPELYAMLHVVNSAAVRVDNGFAYGVSGGDEVEVNI